MYDYAAILFKRRRTLNFFYFYVQLTIHSPGFFTIRFSPLHTRLLLGLYFPLRFFLFGHKWRPPVFLLFTVGQRHINQHLWANRKRKMGERSWSSSPVPGRLIHLLFVSTRLPMDCRTTTTPEKEEEEEEEPM
jgi:hypothetical protein